MADIDSTRRRWIDAGIALAKNPHAKVLCPNCGGAHLDVEDVPYDDGSSMFARYLRCHRCGAIEILDRLRRT